MKRTILALSLCLALFGACDSDEPEVEYLLHVKETGGNYEDCRLVWSEEFDYEGLPNPEIWDYEEGYKRNYELQDYKKEDSKYTYVEDGKLVLEAHADPHDADDGRHFDYSSASLHTKGKKNFKYGRIDIAAKIPVSRGMYPSFWMLPVADAYGKWPKSGEMDIMSYTYGSKWGNQYEKNTISSRIRTEDTESGTVIEPGIGNATTLENAYHLYSMIWKKKRIQFLLDNKVIFTYDKRTNSSSEWPFNKDFHLLLSLAVGGVEGGSFGVDETGFPKRMEIDYIRYYELLNDEETDEVEDPNLIKNGGFEQEFAEGEEPLKYGKPDKEAILDYMNYWFITDNGGRNIISIDKSVRKAGQNSLKIESTEVKNPWDIELSYPIEGVEQGTYTFSFWMKTNIESSPFAASITLCETEEEIKKTAANNLKAVKMKSDGTLDKIASKKMNGGHPYSAIFGKTAGTDWKKYSVTVKLPQTTLVKFLIRPYTSCGGDQWYTTSTVQNAICWFDDFSFEKID